MFVRLMTPADEKAYRSILMRTSDQDRYNRFFRAVDLRDIAGAFTAVADAYERVAFIAEDGADGALPLGAAHAALLDERSVELAIVVAEGARGRGVGRALLVALVTYLRSLGFERFIAHSLQDNTAFGSLAASIGLRIEHAEGADLRWALEYAPKLAIA